MPNEHRTSEQIERDIAENRERLTDSVESLQDRFSLDGIIEQVGSQLQDNGTEIARRVGQTLKDNPMGIALVGAGLAVLAMGGGQSKPAQKSQMSSPARQAPNTPGEGMPYRGSRAGYGAYDNQNMGWLGDEEPGDDHESYFSAAQQAAMNAIGKTREALLEQIESAKDQASKVGARLAEGTEDMSRSAQERVVVARLKALQAQARFKSRMARAQTSAGSFYDRQPLAAGAMAFAAGAAIAASLPRTQQEDNLLGEYRDRLVDDARKVLEEERAKLERVAKTTSEEAKKTATKAFKKEHDDAA